MLSSRLLNTQHFKTFEKSYNTCNAMIVERRWDCEESEILDVFFCLHHLILIDSHVVYPCHGTCLTRCDWIMYLRNVYTRAGIFWRVHEDKELEELSVPPFKILSSPITVISSCFLCKNMVYPRNWTMYKCMLLSKWGVYRMYVITDNT